MTIAELLAELHEKSVTLSVSGDELVVLGKSQIFESTSLLNLLRENKKALIELIKAEKYAGPKEIGNNIPPNRIPRDCEAITPEMLPLAQLSAAEIERIVSKAPGGAANVQDIYPLAPLQEGMLFHFLLEAEGDPYLGQVLYSFDSRSRLDSFLQAMQAVIDRHDILRTAVQWEGLSEPAQVVWRRAPLIIEEVNCDPAAGDVAEQLRARYSPRRYRLDISQAPMMRAYIAPAERGEDAPESRWLMFLLFHHLAVDHFTVEILLEEVQAHLLGRADQLPAPLPFRNFVAQARLGVSREEHEEFFRAMLGDVDEPTAPFGLLGVQEDGSRIEEVAIKLEPALDRRLRDRARALGVSVASLCHLAWARVLARVSGRDDVVFGTVLIGRTQGNEGAERALGLSINTLPVRIVIGEEGVERSVRKTHGLLADLMKHEHASLALAQRCSGVAASTPLFSSLFNYRYSPRNVTPSSEATSAWMGIMPLKVVERTNYPLVLSVDDLGDGFALTTQVVAWLDPGRVCGYMRTALEGLVEALEGAPERAVREIEVMPEAERRHVVEEWNATAAVYPRDKCIHELFEAQVEKGRDAIALVYEEQSLTYAELNLQANRLAHRLRELGVRPGMRVAILLERSVELVVAELAILKSGGAYVPIDPTFPDERQVFMANDSAAQVVVTVRSAPLPEAMTIPRIYLDDMGQSEAEIGNLNLPMRSEMTAYVMYTSGSTGSPKGVMALHRGIGRLVLNCGYADFNESGRVAFAANPAFDAATMEVWAPLLNGGRIVVIDQHCLLNPQLFAAALERHAVSTLWLTAGLFNQYARSMAGSLGHLCYLIVGGDVLDPGVIAQTHHDSPPRNLVNGYGPTETTTFAITHEIKEAPDGVKSIPLGRPISNTQVYILDGRRQPAPIGVAGEIYIGGDGVAQGYLNRPEMTAERFLPDPFSREADARLYKTGDLGRWLPDGSIEFLGRNDYQVKIRGFRVELGEIEAQLGSHPAVRQCVVVAHQDEAAEKRLVAYLVCEAETAPSDGELRDYMLERAPDFMLPSRFVQLKQIPLTPSGKVDRRALPAPGVAGAGSRYVAPIGATETALAQIWAEELKLERVSRDDNFFELGGHSLLAIRLIERMRREGLRANVRTIYTNPILAAFAAAAGGESGLVEVPPNRIPAGSEAITPEMLPLVELSVEEIEIIVSKVPGGAANVQDIYPLAPLQEGILFHYLLETEGEPYLGQILYSFDSRSRLDSFLQAVQAVIDRHDILRTAVQWEGLSEPAQVVWRRAPLIIEEVNCDPAAGDVAEQLRARYSPRRYRLDISQAPLMRGYIAPADLNEDASERQWALLLLFQHMAIDHVTAEILLEEVQAHLLGREDQLPAPLPFRNFVAQARLGVSREEHEKFFRKMLADVDEPTAPYGLIDVQGDGSGISGGALEVDAALAIRLRRTARALGVSVASLCHLAWAQALARVSGRDDVVFGTVLFGRMQGDEGAERALGMFINTLPVRIGIGEEGVERSVRKTHGLLADLMKHEHASLALAQRCSGVAAPTPLFTSFFNYRHSPRDAAPSPEAPSAWMGIKLLKDEERTNYPVALSVDDFGDGFALSAQVVAGIDPVGVCGYMRTALEGLVKALEGAPETAVRAIDVMPEAERRQLVEEWNATEVHYPREKLIHELFEEQVERTPDAVALVCEDRQLSYRELNRRANQLGHHLLGLGVRPEAVVGICVERSLEMVIGILGVLKAGGAYLPLDPDYPEQRLAYIAEDARPAMMVTGESVISRLPKQAGPLVCIDRDWEEIGRGDETNRESRLSPGNLAYVLYTSGSTGNPKGVAIAHSNAVTLIHWAGEIFGPEDLAGVLASTSICFDLSVFELFVSLSWGGKVILVENVLQLPNSPVANGVTLINTVPSAMAELMRMDGVAASVRAVNLAGEPLRIELVDKIYRQETVKRVYDLYGPSEGTTYSTFALRRAMGPGTIGRPIANTQVYLLDTQLQPVPVWGEGER